MKILYHVIVSLAQNFVGFIQIYIHTQAKKYMETGSLIRRKLPLLSLLNPIASYQISKQYTVPPICLPGTCDCEVEPGIPLPNECRH